MKAKKVYSLDLGYTIDRTTQPHTVGLFDVDFRKKSAPNPRVRRWVYGSSAKTLELARKDAKILKDILDCEVRIVRANTGEILEKW